MAALNKEMVNTLLGPIYTCHREGNPCFVFLSGAGFSVRLTILLILLTNCLIALAY